MANDHPNFLSTDCPRTLIVYGCVSDPTKFANKSGASEYGKSFQLTENYALLAPSSPSLRFSSSGWINISPQQLLNVQSTESLFQLCRERIIHRTSQFSNPIRMYIEQYLNFMSDKLEVHKLELGAKIDEDEIYDYKDWIFSSWLPLPHAQILLPPVFADNSPNFAEIDIAFWVDGKLIGVMIDGANTPIKSRQCKLDYLAENHPQFSIVNFGKDHLQGDTFPTNLFPASFFNFWENLSLPHGPCPPNDMFISTDI